MTITVHRAGNLPIYEYIRIGEKGFTVRTHESPAVFENTATLVPNPIHINAEDRITVVAKPNGQPGQSFKKYAMKPGDRFEQVFEGYPLVECK